MDEAPDVGAAAFRAERRFASRKFLLACVVFAVATWLLMAGRIDMQTWQAVVTWDVGLYMAGNAASGLSDAFARTVMRQ